MKTCTKCGESKPSEYFYFHKKRSAYYAHCKSCHRQLTERWASANKEKKREIDAKAKSKRQLLGKVSTVSVEYQREAAKKWRNRHPEKHAINNARSVSRLSKAYVVGLLRAAGVETPSEEVIEMKREHLRLFRLAKQLEQAATKAKEDDEALTKHP